MRLDGSEEDPSEIKNGILKRMESNKKIYGALRTKSHIYSGMSETQASLNSLFDHCLMVGLNTGTIEALSGDTCAKKLNPQILWQFPDNVYIIYLTITYVILYDQHCFN